MGKRTCEETFSIDVNQFCRAGMMDRNTHWQVQAMSESGDLTTLLRVHCPDLATLVLTYHWRDEAEPTTQTIYLDWSNCNYGGGGRPWFHCPGCGDRRVKLYLRRGYYKCRQCHELCYESQLETGRTRGLYLACKLWRKLGGDGAPCNSPPRKPKWMRKRTYRRICNRADEAYERTFPWAW